MIVMNDIPGAKTSAPASDASDGYMFSYVYAARDYETSATRKFISIIS